MMPEKTGSLSTEALIQGVHKTLDAAFAAIPDDHDHAVIIDGTYSSADGTAINGLWVQRVENGWNIVLQGGYSGTLGVNGAAVLARSW